MSVLHCVQVNTNGLISFNRPLNLLKPISFPVEEEDIIAPYWTDIDITDTGNVFFRESTDSKILDKITDEIKIINPRLTKFKAHWAFIVTWDNVLPNNNFTNDQEVSMVICSITVGTYIAAL